MNPESSHEPTDSLNDHGDFIPRLNVNIESLEKQIPVEKETTELALGPTELPSPALLHGSPAVSTQDDNDNVIKSLSSSDSQASSFEIVEDSIEPSINALEPERPLSSHSREENEDGKEELVAESATEELVAESSKEELVDESATKELVAESANVEKTDVSPLISDSQTLKVDAPTPQSTTPLDQTVSVDVDDAEDVAEDGIEKDADLDHFLKQVRRVESLDEIELPVTVKRLKTKYGTRIFLVGTAHFSTQSHDDVSTTIRAVEPDVVMVELCDSRKSILSMDEETILRESKGMDTAKIIDYIKHNGVLQGISYVLLLNLSEQITKQLGMAPGGEFRRAFKETKLLQEKKKCQLYLGDRPVGVTLKRALGMLTAWQKLQLCWSLLTEKLDISNEEIEKMKEKDMLETLLQEMAKDYPTLSQVFVQERDVWLAYALHVAEAMAVRDAPNVSMEEVTHVLPSVVVGVVGMGHQPGIIEQWKKLEDSPLTYEERQNVLMELVRIPPPSTASRVLSFGWKAAKLTLILWSCHKIYKWIYY